ncbi:MAG: FAD-binding protein [Armatimonadetes bacterium]|nr:FAD-binding protein [Armatimonadota bacterium]
MALPSLTRVQTDVLVVGTGGAGLRAALAARQSGAEVLVVSKMAAEARNCTAVAWGGVTYALPEHSEELFRQVVVTGGFLNNQRLVEVLARETPGRVAELGDLGVGIEVLGDAGAENRLGTARIVGGSGPRGFSLLRPLRRRALEMGVRFCDETMVARILRDDSCVTGVLAVRTADGAPLAITAKAIIIATGGGACLYRRHDNPPGTTGDGIALAYEAGAELVDMEFVSFQLPEDRTADLFSAPDGPPDTPPSYGAAHYFLGGIVIDEHCRTTVPGLFAAGEAAGGLFGAGRLGGAALADVLVFGALAGSQAARYAADSTSPGLDEKQIREGCCWLEGLLAGDGESVQSVTARLQDLMWRSCGVIKSGESLRAALPELGDLQRQRTALRVSSAADLRGGLEWLNMLNLARLIVNASLQRQETRGVFWRHDCPEPDNDHWLQSIYWRRTGDEDCCEVRPPVMTRLTEPVAPRIGAGCFDYLPGL